MDNLNSNQESEIFATLTKQEEILELSEIEERKLLSGFSSWNKSFLIKLRGYNYGIFKPKNGEHDFLRPAIPGGTYYKRERAAYLISKFLQLNLIPPTIIRKIDGDVGSLQKFIFGGVTASHCKSEELKNFSAKFQYLFALDYMIFNSDRNWGNCLVENKKLYAIDNGLSFGNDTLRIDYLNYIAIENHAIIKSLVNKIENFLNREERREELRLLTRDLLELSEINACFARIKYFFDYISINKKLPIASNGLFRHRKTRKLLPFWPKNREVKSS